MFEVKLPNGRSTTSLGFGCTPIIGGLSTKSSQALIETAFTVGFRHFDVAPSYGHGTAENVLGNVLKSCREDVTIATKVGIARPRNRSILVSARFIAKPIQKFVPRLWKVASGQVGSAAPPGLFDAKYVRQSLKDSLHRLQTNRLDLYLMHEIREADATDTLVALLVELQAKGIIGSVGMGTSRDDAARVGARFPELRCVCQFSWNLLDPPLKSFPGTFIIIHGTIGRAHEPILAWLAANPSKTREWSAELDCDLYDDAVLADLLLAAAISENRDGIVLASSQRCDRIRRFASVANDPILLADGARFRKIIQTEAPLINTRI
jgi:D-threo-aldose 1-dehydrogenase